MLIIGHRGASVAEAENTPAAFRTADRMGADGVELDVRLAADGRGGHRLVVFHDALPVEQDALDVLPGLVEVFEACGERMLVNVEIKNSADGGGHDPTMAVVAPTLAAMRAATPPDRADRWLISSFDLATIDHVRTVAPEIATAFLCEDLSPSTIGATIAGGHRAIHPWERSITEEGVAAAHRAGLCVNTWTVNDPDRLVELAALGVDGACTDVPDIARAALSAAGRGVGGGGDVAEPARWRFRPAAGGTPA